MTFLMTFSWHLLYFLLRGTKYASISATGIYYLTRILITGRCFTFQDANSAGRTSLNTTSVARISFLLANIKAWSLFPLPQLNISPWYPAFFVVIRPDVIPVAFLFRKHLKGGKLIPGRHLGYHFRCSRCWGDIAKIQFVARSVPNPDNCNYSPCWQRLSTVFTFLLRALGISIQRNIISLHPAFSAARCFHVVPIAVIFRASPWYAYGMSWI